METHAVRPIVEQVWYFITYKKAIHALLNLLFCLLPDEEYFTKQTCWRKYIPQQLYFFDNKIETKALKPSPMEYQK